MSSLKRDFSHKIIQWYLQHKRDLPWRETTNPYYIWLSEIILQQTRVAQGTPYYEAFINQYPSIYELAVADEQEVLKLWQGLGYYSRARNLHFTAKTIVQKHQGIFPSNYHELIKLKGIGDYTAAAIASFCFSEKVPTLDGNVFRVLARIFDIELPINDAKSRKVFKELAHELLDVAQPGTFNQAMMEFGALQCTPTNPDCQLCIFESICLAKSKGKISQLPVKLEKKPIRKRYFDYIIYRFTQEKTILQKRKSNDIWKHLYEFPLIENPTYVDPESILIQINTLAPTTKAKKNIQLLTPTPIKHKLTHQEINIRFWEVKTESALVVTQDIKDLEKYPLPIVIHQFLEQYLV